MFSNLDVWTVQSSEKELERAIAQIHGGLNIIYSNCICDIRIGYEYITTDQFDTLLYNDESGVLIILMRGSNITKEDLISYLEKYSMPYSEVTFTPLEGEYEDISFLPKLFFAKDETRFSEGLEDSKNKGITSSLVYPCIKGTLSFGYITGIHKKIIFDKVFFEGIVQLDNQVIFLMSQRKKYKKESKVTIKNVLRAFKRLGITNEISYDRTTDIIGGKNNKPEKVKRY